ncbi:MAG TPA: hypothetical protein VHG30_00045 [Microvirga sp.]|nr:hypothetical protein [Microvirga sp.]
MTISRTGLLYVAVMLAAGLVIGLIVVDRPALRDAAVPPIAWPLGVSLLMDLALAPVVASGRLPPVTLGERVLAFVGAGLVITAVLAAPA